MKIAHVFAAKVGTLHYYVDYDDQDTRDIVALWASDNRIKDVTQTLDPSWQRTSYLTGSSRPAAEQRR